MRTSVKTMAKVNTPSGQRHCMINFWMKDENGRLRGIWVSGSTFSKAGNSMLAIRMTGDQQVSSGVFNSLDNAVELSTIHGKIKARITGNRIFVKIPDEVAMDHEPLPV